MYTIDEELERLSHGLAGHQLHHHHWDPTSNTGYRSSRNTNTKAQIICFCMNRYIVSACRKKTNIRAISNYVPKKLFLKHPSDDLTHTFTEISLDDGHTSAFVTLPIWPSEKTLPTLILFPYHKLFKPESHKKY